MSVLLLNANSILGKSYGIGYEGENAVTQIDFNLKMWIEEYGLGGATLLVLRHGDKDAYPVPLMIEDGVASWSITKTDTAKVGRGAIQLKYVAGEKIKKSPIFEVNCMNSLDDSDTVPDPYDSWLATLTDLSALVTAKVAEIRGYSDNAQDSADSALSSKAAAEQSASQAALSVQTAQTAETGATASAQTATTKASEAAASAASAQEYDESAQQSAVNAQTSATNAAASEAQAQHYAENASTYLMTDEEATNLLSIAKGKVNE